MYYSHNSKIKYVDSTIEYIGFESFYYTTNSDIVLSFVILIICLYPYITVRNNQINFHELIIYLYELIERLAEEGIFIP